MAKRTTEQIAEEARAALDRARRRLADCATVVEFLGTQVSLAAKAAHVGAKYDLEDAIGDYGVAVEDYMTACASVKRV